MNIYETINFFDLAFFNILDFFDFSKIYFISFLNYYFFYLVFLIFVVYLYFFEKNLKILRTLFFLSLIGFLIIYLLKYTVKRERPKGIVEKIDYSFPSSHSYFAFLIFLFSYFYIKNYFFKIVFIFFSIFSIFSILILKVHYFSDVIFSIFLSFFMFFLSKNFQIFLSKSLQIQLKTTKKILEYLKKIKLKKK